MDAAQLVIFIGLLIFVSHLFAGIFEKKGIPDVLMLMIIGIIIGTLSSIFIASPVAYLVLGKKIEKRSHELEAASAEA